jgi:hypothetical protein
MLFCHLQASSHGCCNNESYSTIYVSWNGFYMTSVMPNQLRHGVDRRKLVELRPYFIEKHKVLNAPTIVPTALQYK